LHGTGARQHSVQGSTDTEPLIISEKITMDTIYDSFYNYKIDMDLNTLLDVCPGNNNFSNIS
jgi:hypothetical protein